MKLTPKNLINYLDIDPTSRTGLRWSQVPMDVTFEEEEEFVKEYEDAFNPDDLEIYTPEEEAALSLNYKEEKTD